MSESVATSTNLSQLFGLRPDQIERVLGCGSEVRLARGAFIFHEGEHADQFYVVNEGLIALEVFIPARGPHIIATLRAGELLGWSWLFPPFRWHFDAQVLEPATLLVFNASCLRDFCETDHDIGYPLLSRFTQIITQRLQATRLQLLDMYKADGK